MLGVPLYLIDGEVDDLEDSLAALADKIDAGFAAQDAKFEARFAAQDAKFEARFAAQDAKFDAGFAAQDARFARLEKGQAEIDRKLTALIASLNKTDAVEAALEGRIE